LVEDIHDREAEEPDPRSDASFPDEPDADVPISTRVNGSENDDPSIVEPTA
jgi:hypothetical protein